MRTTGNTILITGGGSGIGRALALWFAERDNTVIVAGRRQDALDEVAAGSERIHTLQLDVTDPASVASAVAELDERFPETNAVLHGAGIMQKETIGDDDVAIAEAIIASNLTGLIRLNSALVPRLAGRPDAAILTVSSGLAFLPRADNPTYCATKAAVHSYSQSLRTQLRPRGVQVIEIAPPYVQTGLTGPQQAADPRAMPLDEYIAETTGILEREPDVEEVLVGRVQFQRTAESSGEYPERYRRFQARFGIEAA